MEIVKQYLEKRIELLEKGLQNSLYSKLTAEQYRTLLQELEQVLTLFNEEYEKNEEKLSILNDVISNMQSELFSRER